MLWMCCCALLGDDPRAAPATETPVAALLPRDTPSLLDGWLRAAPPLFGGCAGPDHAWSLGGIVRAGYFADERILWSGTEQTIAAQAVLSPELRGKAGAWDLRIAGTVFLNLPQDGNLLNSPANRIYRADIVPPVIDVFNLYAEIQRGDLTFLLGKRPTPFGKYPSQIYTNSFVDAPFLRTDIVGFTDVGVFARWTPGNWRFDGGIVNGGAGLDTNSGKGMVGRIGHETEATWIGASLRADDGDGSEWQKRFRNSSGVDAGFWLGSWWFGGEAVYEQHGFRHEPTTAPLALDVGRRSLYGRDFFLADERAINGFAYWVGTGCDIDRVRLEFNYGESRPEQIGDPWHDAPVKRFLAKVAYRPVPRMEVFCIFIQENRRTVPAIIANTQPYGAWLGTQYTF